MELFRNSYAAAGGIAPVSLPDAGRAAGTLPRPVDLHRLIPGYEPTPIVSLPTVAADLGVGRVLVKYEAERFGLPAFKILGASWAIYQVLSERYAAAHGHPPDTSSFETLRAAFGEFSDVTLATATDGNHGRAVARVAGWFGLGAQIYMPAGSAAARISAIESEGATVTATS